MVTIVVGGQFGGEGKGKVAAYLARRDQPNCVCRCGGPNSSHTVVEAGIVTRLRLLPTAVLTSRPRVVAYGAGALIHVPTLAYELERTKAAPGTLMIDPLAGVVTADLVAAQRADGRYAAIGSTLTGTGYAASARCLRQLGLARDEAELQPYLGNVRGMLSRAMRSGADVLVEGHQGFGLSNYHGDYPFCSSRDTTAAACLSELGIGPSMPMRIILVVRTFPARNHPGRLDEEMSLAEADARGIREFGGGAWGIPDARRRVGRLDLGLVEEACQANGATELAVTGIDYLDPVLRGARRLPKRAVEVERLVSTLESRTGIPVTLLSTGPETDAMIPRAISALSPA